jgi:hypothetical protein
LQLGPYKMGLMLTTGIEPVLAPYKRAILPLEDASEMICTLNAENRPRKNQNFCTGNLKVDHYLVVQILFGTK